MCSFERSVLISKFVLIKFSGPLKILSDDSSNLSELSFIVIKLSRNKILRKVLTLYSR